ncbi:MAG TPA: hypothetical protein VLR69_14355 [Thermoanaerobaculia bacterium]|nr:hypothetical protein [Thermoanaerobaculia bacterium]
MKTFRLLSLSAVVVLAFLSQVKPVLAACGTCTSDIQCHKCTGDPLSGCFNGRCAI